MERQLLIAALFGSYCIKGGLRYLLHYIGWRFICGKSDNQQRERSHICNGAWRYGKRHAPSYSAPRQMGSYLFLFALAAFMPQPINNISQAHNPAINPVVPMLSNCNFSATLNIFTTIVPHSIKASNKRTSNPIYLKILFFINGRLHNFWFVALFVLNYKT